MKNEVLVVGSLCRTRRPGYANKSHPYKEAPIKQGQTVKIIGIPESNQFGEVVYTFSTLDGEKVGTTIDRNFLILLSPLEQLAGAAE